VANLARQTPHRVMRELYGQYLAYSQAVVNAIPTYSSTDHYLVAASNKFYSALTEVCKAIYYHSAQESAPSLPQPSAPSDPAAPDNSEHPAPQQFLSSNAGMCKDWITRAEQFDTDTAPWRAVNLKVPATEWTSQDKAAVDAATSAMTTYADDMESSGRESQNPVWEDFAVLAAQYMRAYVQAVPTYTSNFGYLVSQATYLNNAIYWACKANH